MLQLLHSLPESWPTWLIQNSFSTSKISFYFLQPRYRTPLYLAPEILILQLEALITILFWPIHFYDRTLLVDPTVAPELPLSVEMNFHFFPAFFLMLDTLFFSPPWETHALSALMLFSAVGGGYWIWVERCFTYNNFYPYPLMALMNPRQRMLLFAFATLLCWSSFLTVRELYRIVNGEIERRRSQEKKRL